LAEIHQVATDDIVKPLPEEEDDRPPFFQDVSEKANELISDLVSRPAPYDFQDLVAAVLRAMGYKAVSSPPGRDRGIDIAVHPDTLGFERPRIKVQVKHRKESTKGPEMRSFLGALRAGDNGLYVSTGGFANDAKMEAGQSHEPVTILDRDGFIMLMLEHYEAMEPEFQSKVPLRKVWVPTE
jgi:restriction system protein